MCAFEDVIRGIKMVQALGPCSGVRSVVIEGIPASKARPRFTKHGHAYHPKKNKKEEEYTASCMRDAFAFPVHGNIAVSCIFYRPNKQRIDLDNMIKHVCDAANGVVWHDDYQVTALIGVLELDADAPRTVITFAQHASSMVRNVGSEKVCEVCQKPFVTKLEKHISQRTCSPACGAILAPATKGHRVGPRYCECGTKIAKSSIKQCRKCWRESRAKNSDEQLPLIPEKEKPHGKAKAAGRSAARATGGRKPGRARSQSTGTGAEYFI